MRASIKHYACEWPPELVIYMWVVKHILSMHAGNFLYDSIGSYWINNGNYP